MPWGGQILKAGKDRIIGLDILRGIAILLVMYEHGNSLLPTKLIKYFIIPRPSIDGVSIFFVLSGFLIGRILIKIINTSNFTFKDILNFWIRRWLRTIPNYYFILMVLILCNVFITQDIGHANIKYFIFSQNLYEAHPLFFPEAWSLSIEEWFYLLFPILAFFLFKSIKKKNESVIIVAIIFLIIPLLLRIIKYYYQIGDQNWDLNYRKIIILRLDSLMYGIIGAYFSIFRKQFWGKIKYSGLIVSVSLIFFLIVYSSLPYKKPFFDYVYHFNLESLSILFSLPYFSELRSIKYKNIANVFTFISLISYSMYLINLTLVRDILVPDIIKLVGLNYGVSPFLNIVLYISQFFLYWFLTIFFSYYLYRYLELPIMKIRNRLEIK